MANNTKTKIVAKKPVKLVLKLFNTFNFFIKYLSTRQSVDGSKSNNNETLTVRSQTRQSMAGNTKFQLDPKFFVNEFDSIKEMTKNFNTESIDLNPIVNLIS